MRTSVYIGIAILGLLVSSSLKDSSEEYVATDEDEDTILFFRLIDCKMSLGSENNDSCPLSSRQSMGQSKL